MFDPKTKKKKKKKENQYKVASRRLLKDSDRQLCDPHPS